MTLEWRAAVQIPGKITGLVKSPGLVVGLFSAW